MDLDDERDPDPVDEILSADLGPVAESGGGRWGTRQKKVKELTPKQFEREVTKEILAFVTTGKMTTTSGPILFDREHTKHVCRMLEERDPDALKTLAATPGHAGTVARSHIEQRAKRALAAEVDARHAAGETPKAEP